MDRERSTWLELRQVVRRICMSNNPREIERLRVRGRELADGVSLVSNTAAPERTKR